MQRVLVVEDCADIREMLLMLFEGAGYEVFTAADGLEGVDMARALKPRVIIMDINLPGIDGVEATRRIKSSWGLNHVQVVANSAIAVPALQESMFASVCNKTSPPEVLLNAVASAASGNRSDGEHGVNADHCAR
jgi:two-component system cell cycle response regulator DivK